MIKLEKDSRKSLEIRKSCRQQKRNTGRTVLKIWSKKHTQTHPQKNCSRDLGETYKIQGVGDNNIIQYLNLSSLLLLIYVWK